MASASVKNGVFTYAAGILNGFSPLAIPSIHVKIHWHLKVLQKAQERENIKNEHKSKMHLAPISSARVSSESAEDVENKKKTTGKMSTRKKCIVRSLWFLFQFLLCQNDYFPLVLMFHSVFILYTLSNITNDKSHYHHSSPIKNKK